jgi:diguanylate cyclase (GGDEF)-like protein
MQAATRALQPLCACSGLLLLQESGVVLSVGARQTAPAIDWVALAAASALRYSDTAQLIFDCQLEQAPRTAIVLQLSSARQLAGVDLALIQPWLAALRPWLAFAQRYAAHAQDMAETESVLQLFDVGTFRIDLDEGNIQLDAAAASVSGLPAQRQNIAIPKFLEGIRPEQRADFLYSVNRALTLGQRGRIVYQTSAGEWRAALFALDPGISEASRSQRRVIGILRDYSQMRATEQDAEQHQAQLEALVKHLRAHSRTDPLTGLANRMELTERLSVAAIAAKASSGIVSMLVIDVDHFKAYNDSFGHAAGDITLKAIADAIKAEVPLGDLAARFGGEEFCVLSIQAEPGALAERIRAAIEHAAWPNRQVTVSIGVSSAAASHFDADQLFKAADNALYAAKRAGRNRVCMSDAQ